MTPETDPVATLREELVRAAVRAAARRRARRVARTRGALAVAVFLLAVTLAFSVVRPAPAQADVRVRVADGRVIVTLEDLEHDPRKIEVAARRAGLAVSVVAVPVGPSDVGRFVGEAGSLDLPADVRLVEPADGTFIGFSLPLGWPGSLELRVGRPASGDETYARFADALAPGGPLACRPVLGRPVADVARELRGLPLVLRVQDLGPPPGPLVRLRSVIGTELGRSTVLRADATSRRRVVLEVSDDPTAPRRAPTC